MSFRKYAISLLAIGSVGLSSYAQLPSYSWTQVPMPQHPYGADQVVETNEAAFAIAYSQVYRIEGALGESWSTLNALPDSLVPVSLHSSTELLAVLAGPLAGTRDDTLRRYLYVSEDHGVNFEQRARLQFTKVGDSPIISIAGRIIGYEDLTTSPYRGDRRQFLSLDAGQTWQSDSLSLDDIYIREPAAGSYIRNARSYPRRLEWSSNAGISWELLPDDGRFASINSTFALGDTVAAYSSGGNTLHLYHPSSQFTANIPLTQSVRTRDVRLRNGVLLSNGGRIDAYSYDRGRTWGDVVSASPRNTNLPIESIATANGSVFCSFREGITEVLSPPGTFQPVSAQTELFSSHDAIGVGTDRFLSVRSDGNQTDIVTLEGRTAASIASASYEVAEGHSDGERFHLVGYRRGSESFLLRSTDLFVSADTIPVGPDNFSLQCRGARCGFVTVEDSIYLSVDGAETWTNKSADWGGTLVRGIGSLMLLDDGLCYTTTRPDDNDYQLVCRDDDGNSLRTLATELFPTLSIVTRGDYGANNVFIGTELGYRIDSSGQSLRRLGMDGYPTARPYSQEHFQPRSILGVGDSLVAFGSAGIPYYSTDGGDSWEAWTEGLPPGYLRSGRILGDGLLLSTSTGVYYVSEEPSSTRDRQPFTTSELQLSPNPVRPGQTVAVAFKGTDGVWPGVILDGAGKAQNLIKQSSGSTITFIAPQRAGVYVVVVTGEQNEVYSGQLVVH